VIIAKRVRIVHSPAQDQYCVQYKTWLLGSWHDDETIAYRKPEQRPENFRPHWTQDEANKKAHARASVLLEREVVFNGRR
jgi:hypothetical protein